MRLFQRFVADPLFLKGPQTPYPGTMAAVDVRVKEAQLRALEEEQIRVLEKLERLDALRGKALFEQYTKGEIDCPELERRIDAELAG